MRSMFSSFDVDSSGSISLSEMKNLFNKLNITISDDDAACMFKSMDKDGMCLFMHPFIYYQYDII